jgi:glutamate N-acetyltransferase / amino-acid N-acetyltransferase
VPVDSSRVSVSFIPAPTLQDPTVLTLLQEGEPQYLDEDRAKVILSEEDIFIQVDLGLGNSEATYWTCDLSHVCFYQSQRGSEAEAVQEYVSINGDYRS